MSDYSNIHQPSSSSLLRGSDPLGQGKHIFRQSLTDLKNRNSGSIEELHPILLVALAGDCPFCKLFKQTTRDRLLPLIQSKYPDLRHLIIDSITRMPDSVEMAIKEAGWTDHESIPQLARSIPHWPALLLISPNPDWKYRVYGKTFLSNGTLVADPNHKPLMVIMQNITLENIFDAVSNWLDQQLILPEFQSIRIMVNSPNILTEIDYPPGTVEDFLELLTPVENPSDNPIIFPVTHKVSPETQLMKPVHRFRVGRPEKFGY